MTTRLAQQTQKAAGIPNGMRTATIAAVSATGITISVSGGQFTSGVGVLGSYAPTVGDTVAVFRQDSSWLILGEISTIGGQQAARRVATATAVADGAASSGTTEAIDLSVTLSVIANMTYHLKIFVPFSGTVAADRFLFRIREDLVITGAQLTYAPGTTTVATSVYTEIAEVDWVAPTTRDDQSFSLTYQRQSGTGVVTPRGATSQPRFLSVELVAF